MAKQSMVSIATQEEDLCNWEFINRSELEISGGDDDDDSIYEVESVDLVESLDSLSSSFSSSEQDVDVDVDDDDDDERDVPTKIADAHDHGDLDDAVNCARVSDLGQNHGYYDGFHSHEHDYDGGHQHVYDDDDDDDDGDESDDGYDMDDELVPWEVKDRFVRQRIRKSGKKSFARMTKCKKAALIFTRPGCVRGKHGLGLQFY